MPLRDTSKYNLVVEGEPEVVTEIRKKIISSFDDLEFVDEGHKYFIDGRELTSVSNVSHMFQEEFDSEKVAARYALKHPGTDAQYWLDEWQKKSLKATITGTLVHAFAESYGWLRAGHPELITEECKSKYIADKGWLIPTRDKEESVINFFKWMDDINNDPNKGTFYLVMNETKVYSGLDRSKSDFKLDYAGTFDALYYYDDKNNPENSGLCVFDWKGLDVNTPILTKDGWKTMGTIMEGDIVFDKDGKETKVIHASEVHHNPCYKISFDTNESVVADHEHRWFVTKIENGMPSECVMTTEEMADFLSKSNENSVRIYNVKPLEVSSSVNNSGMTRDCQVRLISDISSRNKDVSKFITELYDLQNETFECRENILYGIMACRGKYDFDNRCYVLTSKTEKEFELFDELVSSLGIKATVVDNLTLSFNYGKDLLDIYDIEATDMPYSKIYGINEEDTYRTIVSVEKVDTIPTRCIGVDSPSHTYVFGHSFIVTHNTNKELYNDYNRLHSKTLNAPFAERFEEAYANYTIQLSCYQIPLEDLGLKVIARRLVWLKENGEFEVVPTDNVTEKIRDYLTNKV